MKVSEQLSVGCNRRLALTNFNFSLNCFPRNKVQARFNNGVLEVELERLEADRPKKIEIRRAAS